MKHIKYISLQITSWEGDESVQDCVKVICTSQTRTFVMYFADMASIAFYQKLYLLVNSPFVGFVRYLRLTLGRVLSLQAKYLDGEFSDFVHLNSLSLESDLEVWLLNECNHRLFESLKPKHI